ncbi:RHS repeat-associated protein [Pantoea agglomerans]|jgi:insecticidal toxin complex protein TccC|uniref:RHS repeat-associated core domain-containing protein n=1 Tax=Enterobacter agglomerans TaxID=549 RepID=UPI0027882564|nr:RHS repeat-associated core domain-containing protein [Pantoea agglomerans]MDQ0431066.1 insecticidal toxin complex protein TccC [Pantoea agglomerans]
MSKFSSSLHADTPYVTVKSTIGPVRTLTFLRLPDEQCTSVKFRAARILTSRVANNLVERTTHQYGARALKDERDNLVPDASTVLGIGVHSVSLYTADSDRIFTMADAAGRSVMVRNAQDTVTAYFYEHPELGARPLLITETPPGGVPRARSMTVWRMPGSEHRARNLALMPLTEYDNAGSSAMLSMSLTGQPLEAEQRLLPADAPPPDWGPDSPCMEVSLITSGACDATGSLLSQKDAAGGVTTTAYNITGAVSRVSLTTSDGMEYGALSSVKRAADGRVIMQSAGNGMAQVWEYDMRTRRLSRHLTLNRDGVLLSELRYTYEPAGNMLTLSNAAVNTQWHRNGESGGVRAYLYDTVSRLLSVESRQKKVAASRPGPFPGQQADGSAGLTWVRYAECYTYDDGDNLIKTVRKGSACGNGWTRNTLMSRRSNRGVIVTTPGKLAGSEVRLTTYAGGCEWRQRTEHENLLSAEAVITEVACLRVIRTRVSGQTAWLARWSWRDHLGSLSGETDENGSVSSREEYAPYGESLGADDDELSINKRTRRFSGMERDATGLYYFGWRYCQPGAGRWLNADPGGLIDGVNLFRFCKTNPIRFIDADGKKPSPAPENYFNDPRMNDPDTKKKVAELLEIYPLGDGRGYEHFGTDTIDMLKKWNSRQGRSSAKIDHIEYGALEMYTRTYMMTNQALLDDSPEESLKNYVSAANSGIKKLAEADGRQSESFLFLGMRLPADNFFIRLNSGDVFRTKYFFSTSRSMRTAKDFSRPVFEGQYPVLIGLPGAYGSDISSISSESYEKEVVFPTQTK